MAHAPDHNLSVARDAFYAEIGSESLAPLWTVLKALVPPQPASPCRPPRWPYDRVRPYLMRAAS